MTFTDVGRKTDDVSVYQGIYNQLKVDAGITGNPSRVYLLVDRSGSMSLDTVQPTYGDFVEWLEGQGVTPVEETFGDEAWLQYIDNL